MGKKKKGAVCNNPVAMARASGPAPVTGPTIRDYLARDRPSLEEATALLQSAAKRKESGTLAAYEEQMNDRYRDELRRHRERVLASHGAGESSRSRSSGKVKKKKKKKSHTRSRSRSRSRSSSPHHRRKSKKKHSKHRRHYPSTSDESDSDRDEHGRSETAARAGPSTEHTCS